MKDAKVPIAVEKAKEEDAEGIAALVERYSFKADGSGQLIPVSEAGILEIIRKNAFYVARLPTGQVVACGSVVEYSGIAEVRTVATHPDYINNGLASAILMSCIEEARERGYKIVYTLTQKQNFGVFEKAGFLMTAVPEKKLEKDCYACPIREKCNETAMSVKL